jgi:DNA-binding NarL/FixJ family response regulator
MLRQSGYLRLTFRFQASLTWSKLMRSLQILVADDHDAVRMLLRTILETVPGWQVCGEAEDGATAVALAGILHPDVIIMDLVMPDTNGFDAVRAVLRSNRNARVILMTLHEIPSFIDEAQRAGACGCFFKTESGRHLIPAVRVATEENSFFTPDDLEYLQQAQGASYPPRHMI